MARRKMAKGAPSMAVLIGMGGGKLMDKKPMMEGGEMGGSAMEEETAQMPTEETLSLEFGKEDIPEFRGAKAGDKVVLTGTIDRVDKEGGRVYFDSFKMAEAKKPETEDEMPPLGASKEQVSESINKKRMSAVKSQPQEAY